MKKKFLSVMASILLLVSLSILPVFASTNYSTTYNMYGGVFTQRSFNVTDYCNIIVSPTDGSPDCDMEIYTAEKTWHGMVAKDYVATVSSVSGSNTTYNGVGDYYLYFRNFAGVCWTGGISITWE